MVDVSVQIEDGRWRSALPDAGALAARAVAAASRHLAAGGMAWAVPVRELTVLLGDDGLVRALNSRFRGRDRPTNVLSFTTPLTPGPQGAPAQGQVSGDMALAFETVSAEAADQGKPLADHVTHLIVHGFLHILGHDHDTPAAEADMESLERAILDELGIGDPYSLPSNHISARNILG